MNALDLVSHVSSLEFENTFNPYSCNCEIHDRGDAAQIRSDLLRTMLNKALSVGVDTIWVARDLGYRGGRRTGLALTDDVHIYEHAKRWGITSQRPTKGSPVAERTASIIWDLLGKIQRPIFLWNVFPLHPHEPQDVFSNRSHNAQERKAGEEILFSLIDLLKPQRIVAIGNDAGKSAQKLFGERVDKVRHPSYGGQTIFQNQISEIYGLN